MGKTLEITCDGCGDDIAYTGNCVDYRLVLTSEAKAPWYAREGLEGGAVTAMYISRPISRDHTFCNMVCLDYWSARRRKRGALAREWLDHWKLEHGTQNSWPVPPAEVERERDEALDAAALSEFPRTRDALREFLKR